MKLGDLIGRLQRPLIEGPLDVDVATVTADSRQVVPGSIFVAIRGEKSDGRKFTGQAANAGAAVIVSDRAREAGDPEFGTWVQVADPRRALSALAAGLAGDPSNLLRLIGVTGTNGKTTTAYLCHHIMKSAWHRAGLLGTVLMDDGEECVSATHTTPDPVALHGLLRRMADHACRGAVLEVSSHGIVQRRVADIAFDGLVFTNLSQDHLDYHGTMQAYEAAKRSWFETTAAEPRGKKPTAVVNGDDPVGDAIAQSLEGRMPVIKYGFGLANDFRAMDFRQSPKGLEFKLSAGGRFYLVRAPLIGRFNVMNLMAALAATKSVGVPLRQSISALSKAPQVPGRMEHCGSRDGVSVFVDYAHTPDALEHACETLRELEPKRLITVFGCGGDRDRMKRPLMGRAAARNSEICLITSDNPRSENPQDIIAEIESGMGSARYKVVVDRAEAIRIAVHAGAPGDIVLIAGKGHETYQQFADRTIDFDDRREAKRALEERAVENPDMR